MKKRHYSYNLVGDRHDKAYPAKYFSMELFDGELRPSSVGVKPTLPGAVIDRVSWIASRLRYWEIRIRLLIGAQLPGIFIYTLKQTASNSNTPRSDRSTPFPAPSGIANASL